MGINFNDLLKNLGTTAAKMSNDTAKIDSKAELNTYVSGWDAIKAKADDQNKEVGKDSAEFTNIETLENDMKSELASLMGADFKKQANVETKEENGKVVFAEDENVLEDMMSILAQETDGVDLDTLREYNKKGIGFAEDIDAPQVLEEAGFDPEFVEILGSEVPGALVHIKHAIKNNTPQRFEQMYKNAEELGSYKLAYIMSKENEFAPAFA